MRSGSRTEPCGLRHEAGRPRGSVPGPSRIMISNWFLKMTHCHSWSWMIWTIRVLSNKLHLESLYIIITWYNASRIPKTMLPPFFIQDQVNSDASLCLRSNSLLLCLMPAIIHNHLRVRTEPTRPRCGSDLTHAVSRITAPLLNTNVHLLMVAQAK